MQVTDLHALFHVFSCHPQKEAVKRNRAEICVVRSDGYSAVVNIVAYRRNCLCGLHQNCLIMHQPNANAVFDILAVCDSRRYQHAGLIPQPLGKLHGLDDDFATLKLLSQELSFRAQTILAKRAA